MIEEEQEDSLYCKPQYVVVFHVLGTLNGLLEYINNNRNNRGLVIVLGNL